MSWPISGTPETSLEIRAVTLHAPTSRVSFRVNHRRDLTLFRYTSDKLSRHINCQHRCGACISKCNVRHASRISLVAILSRTLLFWYNTVSCLFFISSYLFAWGGKKRISIFFFLNRYPFKIDIRTNQTIFGEFIEFISACRIGVVPFNFSLCSLCLFFCLDLAYCISIVRTSICQNILWRSLIADYKAYSRVQFDSTQTAIKD